MGEVGDSDENLTDGQIQVWENFRPHCFITTIKTKRIDVLWRNAHNFHGFGFGTYQPTFPNLDRLIVP